MKIPKSEDIVKISHIFKNAIVICGLGTIGSLMLLAVGFFSHWPTPAFYIVFLATFLSSLSGVFTFGILYFRKNERKGVRIGNEENKKLDIIVLEKQIELEKVKQGIIDIEVKNYGDENEN